jgi:hypothetical protein
VETLPAIGDLLFAQAYDGSIGTRIMNTLNFTCALLLTVLLPFTLFAFSVKLFFTDDELTEMGVRIEPIDVQGK